MAEDPGDQKSNPPEDAQRGPFLYADGKKEPLGGAGQTCALPLDNAVGLS
jgi:hypothetical protein